MEQRVRQDDACRDRGCAAGREGGDDLFSAELVEVLLDLLLDTVVEHVALLVEDEVVGIAVVLLVAELGDVVILDLRDGVDESEPHFLDRDFETDLFGRLELGATGATRPSHGAWGIHGGVAVGSEMLRCSGVVVLRGG